MRTKKWTTRDGTKVRIMDMMDSHLLNVYKMLMRVGQARKHNAEMAYLYCGEPQGEIAQLDFERELNSVLWSDWSDHAPEIWEDIHAEILHRGLIKELDAADA